ncbi:unnamed protein product [Gordionus sp. m RMFG-2023]
MVEENNRIMSASRSNQNEKAVKTLLNQRIKALRVKQTIVPAQVKHIFGPVPVKQIITQVPTSTFTSPPPTITTTKSPETIINEFCKDKDVGLYANYDADCRSFYVCGPRSDLKLCPFNTRFDSTLNICNWQNLVRCEIECIARGNIMLGVAKYQCSKFNVCYNGLVVLLECPMNTVFNNDIQNCDFKDKVDLATCKEKKQN